MLMIGSCKARCPAPLKTGRKTSPAGIVEPATSEPDQAPIRRPNSYRVAMLRDEVR